MPQMSPMDWFILSMFFLMIYFFSIMMIYFLLLNFKENLVLKVLKYNFYNIVW